MSASFLVFDISYLHIASAHSLNHALSHDTLRTRRTFGIINHTLLREVRSQAEKEPVFQWKEIQQDVVPVPRNTADDCACHRIEDEMVGCGHDGYEDEGEAR